MKRLVVGVIGHVDHGKTALVGALTGQDTDRLPEEQARGISIALGFAHLRPDSETEIDLIDMPGHERFVRTMISGATGIDAVLLVVAADEGLKPQTREHVDIAGLLGLRRALVAITKVDLASAERAAEVAGGAAVLLEEAGIEPLPPVFTSARTGQGMGGLAEALCALARGQPPHPADGIAFLPIDRAFVITGHGPVVTGTLRGGAITAGELLELLPARVEVRVRSLQVHGARVDTARPGQRVAVNLRGVELSDLGRGMALAPVGALELSDWLTVSLHTVKGAPPLHSGMRLRALFGAAEGEARLRLLDRDVIEPGEAGFAQIHLAEPAGLVAGEPVVLRLTSPSLTVAGGRVLEPVTRRRRRHDAAALTRLAALRDLTPARLIAAEVAQLGAHGTSLRALSRLTALSFPAVNAALREAGALVTRNGLVVRAGVMEQITARIPSLLAAESDGLTQTALATALPGTGAAVLDEALGRLLASGKVAKRGSRLVIPRPEQDSARARSEDALAARIAASLRKGALSPPAPAQIVIDAATRRAVDRLLRDGVIVRAVDRAKGKEILFHREAIAEARARLTPLLDAGEGLLVTEIGAALGISRKYSMPLVDHLDMIRFTRRVGDRRVRC